MVERPETQVSEIDPGDREAIKYEVQYVKGKENTAADYVSRHPSEVDQSVNNDVFYTDLNELFFFLGIKKNYA